MTEEEMQDLFGTDTPFSDFFNTFFGGATAEPGGGRRARAGRTRARQGRDLEHEIELTLEEADQGVTRRLSMKHDGHSRTVDVRVPAGVGDGSRVRVSGEGERGQSGGCEDRDCRSPGSLERRAIFTRRSRCSCPRSSHRPSANTTRRWRSCGRRRTPPREVTGRTEVRPYTRRADKSHVYRT